MLLKDIPFLIVDCQTSATTATRGSMIEIAWTFRSAQDRSAAIQSFLILPYAGYTLSATTQSLTGLTEEAFRHAIAEGDVWELFLQAMKESKGVEALAHFAQFEKSFFLSTHARYYPEAPLDLRFVCSHKIAKRLFPALPSVSLNAIYGYLLGDGPFEFKRASANVEATAEIWSKLVTLLNESGVTTRQELDQWLAQPVGAKPKTKFFSVERALRLDIPNSPGIYRFYSGRGRLLYIGKATNLRSRVNSYFRSRRWDRDRFAELMTQVHRIEHTETTSVTEALLRENEEIKTHQPPYNTALKTQIRPLTYFSKELDEQQNDPSAKFCTGPFKSGFFVHLLEALRSACEGGVIMAELFPHVPDEQIIREGLESFASHNPSLLATKTPLSDWVRYGESLDYYDPSSEEDDVWDPQRVVHSIHNKLRRTADMLNTSRWLCRLVDSTFAWKSGEQWLVVRTCGSRIEFGSVTHESEVPVPSQWKRPLLERQQLLESYSYDRLSLLLSEIKRLSVAQTPARLVLSPCAKYDESQLERWLGA